MSARLVRAFAGLTLGALVLVPLPSAQAQTPAPRWESSVENGTRYLRYSASVTLLGKPARIKAIFYCNPTRGRNENGALGFDLQIAKVSALSPFSFQDFEGPDAAVPGKPMRVTIARAGQPDLVFDLAPNGSSPEGDDFMFGFAEVSHQTTSEPKAILKALARGADIFRATITDPRKPELKLDIAVPVTGKAAAFEALLAGVK